ncbi:hypothetical protein ES705_14399 [subsurface metagenome]
MYDGRDFYFSCDIVSGTSMSLKVNGVQKASGTTIDFDDVLIEDVNSIRLDGSRWSTTFDSKIYYFKLVEIIKEIDVQVDMQVTDPEAASVESLEYSHKTNVSQPIDLDIWNWNTEQWYEIESVSNSGTFDDDSFTLGQDSQYVNSSNGVRIRYQASGSFPYQLEIDRLALNYTSLPQGSPFELSVPNDSS